MEKFTIKPLLWSQTKGNSETLIAVIPFGLLSIKKLYLNEAATHVLDLNSSDGTLQEKIMEGSMFECQVRGREFYDQTMKVFLEPVTENADLARYNWLVGEIYRTFNGYKIPVPTSLKQAFLDMNQDVVDAMHLEDYTYLRQCIEQLDELITKQ